ncbi:hypothetical protein LRS71_09450 [Rhodococcus pyridinivorans]|uniref:hypothetical protein n=1 Tax=Rhodococcus pyridinivorans TaxID=103816 RepID=UPI001E4F47C7|nr:hypothetical protein [Rhodococcus pyridinivorans]MCD5419778.1 hypothetical protein [Rhodococcus pyridinivorans]
MAKTHHPLGPNGSWKTGQRVPADGNYVDQYGFVSTHEKHASFPPCIGRKGEVAYRKLVSSAADSA